MCFKGGIKFNMSYKHYNYVNYEPNYYAVQPNEKPTVENNS